jgi:hypothetical protein
VGTYMEGELYFCKYFQFIIRVIVGFEENNAIAKKKVKLLMKAKEIE